jgi:protein TonB
VQKEKKDKHFIKKPTYPGGRKALQEFISKNLKYPAEALQNKIEGTVNLKYTIDHKGKVIDTQVISGPGHGCNEEAERLAKLLRFDVPGQARKVRVTFTKDLHIHFRLPKTKKKAAQPARMKYTYTTAKTEPSEAKSPSSGSYTYTIKFP